MRTRKNSAFRKAAVIICAAVLIICATVGGTLAWLIDTTDEVVNTFTVGNIDIDLKESPLDDDGELKYVDPANSWEDWTTAINDYKFIPGTSLNKNPTVKVFANSEACYLFVIIDLINWPGTENIMLDLYTTNDDSNGWTLLEPETIDSIFSTDKTLVNGQIVLYRMLDATKNDEYFGILEGDSIIVDGALTKEEIDGILTALGTDKIELNFRAVAIQQANIGSLEDAWEEAEAALESN